MAVAVHDCTTPMHSRCGSAHRQPSPLRPTCYSLVRYSLARYSLYRHGESEVNNLHLCSGEVPHSTAALPGTIHSAGG